MAEIDVGRNEFSDEVLNSDIPVLVDFWASWCGPCKMLSPVISQIAELYDGKLKVCKVNVDESTDLAMEYHVESIPSVKIFKGGKIVSESLGFKPLPAMKQMIDEVI
ncbi:MAG: thioredoxin [Clostridiales bacterium]|nr:thioredoxin [Clostridiales bacterium]HAW15297.1 thioredoxin [Clostridiales bacterium]